MKTKVLTPEVHMKFNDILSLLSFVSPRQVKVQGEWFDLTTSLLPTADGYHRWGGFHHRAVQPEPLNKGARPASRWSFLVINASGKVQVGNSIIAWSPCRGSSVSKTIIIIIIFAFFLSFIQHSTQEICFLTEKLIRSIQWGFSYWSCWQNPGMLYLKRSVLLITTTVSISSGMDYPF